jgi:negative regulator of sigma-B (phosphoserine phosphatase)
VRVEARIHGRPCAGESRSGDAGLVRTLGDVTWVLLVDALGHGEQAADTAELALAEAEKFGAELSIEAALLRLHVRLAGTRGAAAALLRFDTHGLSLGGVGNVEVRTLHGASVPYAATRGVLGHRLPPLRGNSIALTSPGSLLMFTDGIDRRAPLQSLRSVDADVLCSTLLRAHAIERDDAMLVHVSYSLPPQRDSH